MKPKNLKEIDMASGTLNKVILIGRLGSDPEIRYTPAGVPVANFSIATSEAWTDSQGQKKERTEWHRIVAWRKLAEICGEYLSKGSRVYVEGKIQNRQWEDRDGIKRFCTDIQAREVIFLSTRDDAQGQRQAVSNQKANGASETTADDNGPPPLNDETVPF